MAITSYKGMDKDMRCRGFQYQIGEIYTTDDVQVCESGFHACEVPLDVFAHYGPNEGNRFFEVEQDGELSRENGDSKVASSVLKVGAEIGIPGLVKAHVEWVKRQIQSEKTELNTGDRSAATNTGDRSAATNTGDYSAATNTGDYSAATNTGYCSAATNTGYGSAAEVSGKDSVAVVTGFESRARGALGCAIVVTERGGWNGETYPIVGIKAAIVDGETIKANVWYTLKNGEFVEVSEDDND